MAEALPVERDARSSRDERPLRLLWLIDSLTMGGAESLAVSFAREAASRNVELVVCARTSIAGNPLEREIADAGIAVVNLGAKTLRDRGAFRQLLRLVREQKIDVIHAHLAYSAIWGALASRITGVPLVATLHVAPPSRAALRERMRQRLLVSLLNRYASKIVMVSDAQRRAWGSAIAPRKVRVVHNGIPSVALAQRNGSGKPLRILTVAVLREGKGIDILLEALRLVTAQGEHVDCTIVGDGPLRERWMEAANGLPVQWPGFRRDVAALIGDADLFVLPTLADAFPTVLLEAMAAGTPVVASNVGGVPEIVDAPHTGWLVPPGDSRALANAILRAARDDEWRTSAAAAGRRRFEDNFTLARWFDRLHELYSEVRR